MSTYVKVIDGSNVIGWNQSDFGLLPAGLGSFNFNESVNVNFAILDIPFAGRINGNKHLSTLELGANAEGILGYFDSDGAIDVLAPFGCDDQALFKTSQIIVNS